MKNSTLKWLYAVLGKHKISFAGFFTGFAWRKWYNICLTSEKWY